MDDDLRLKETTVCWTQFIQPTDIYVPGTLLGLGVTAVISTDKTPSVTEFISKLGGECRGETTRKKLNK